MNRHQRRASAAVQRRDAKSGEPKFTFELRCPKCSSEETVRTNTALTARDAFRCAACGEICPAAVALQAAQIARELQRPNPS